MRSRAVSRGLGAGAAADGVADEHPPPAGGRVHHHVEDLVAVAVLGDVGGGAGGHHGVHEAALRVRGEDDHGDRRAPVAQPREQLERVLPRHPQVEHGEVGSVMPDQLLGGRGVAGLADDGEATVLLERADDPGAEQRVVVGDDHARPARGRRGGHGMLRRTRGVVVGAWQRRPFRRGTGAWRAGRRV